MTGLWLLWIITAYVCGSVPFSLLIGYAHGVDIRTQGSGNVGASNCGRVLGRRWGVLCLLLDVAKGTLPVVMSGLAMGTLGNREIQPAQAWWWLAVAAGAVVGHVFPIWLRFRGGKGVATGLGVLLGVYPFLTTAAVVAAFVWVCLILATRYISVASIGAALTFPLYLLARLSLDPTLTLRQQLPFLAVTGVLALLVVWRHRSNIGRLLAGTENRVQRRRDRPPTRAHAGEG